MNTEQLSINGYYEVKCYDAEGVLKWEEGIPNLVVTVGKNDMLDKYFAGTTYTAGWYMGLVDGATSPTYAAGDTLASHPGWTENTSYSGTDRITVGWTSASAGSKVSTSTSFSINATATIAGALLCTSQAKSNTSGILFSAGSFAANKPVVSGDTLSVTYTVMLT
jgi:hypothetical protein